MKSIFCLHVLHQGRQAAVGGRMAAGLALPVSSGAHTRQPSFGKKSWVRRALMHPPAHTAQKAMHRTITVADAVPVFLNTQEQRFAPTALPLPMIG
jgi:hypothetical protein